MAWVNVFIQGLLLGGLFALFALGLSLVFGVMRLVNLAHGDLGIMAAFVALACVQWLHLPLVYAGVLAVVIMFVVGYALQRGLLNFTLGTDDTRPILVTFGLSIIVQNALLIGFSADTQGLQATALSTSSVRITGSLAIGYYPLGVFVFAVLFIAGLQLFLNRTKIGRACLLGAHAAITGSVVIGDEVWVGPNATISSALTVGSQAAVSLGSVVTRDVPPGERVSGNFAITHNRFLSFIRSIR